MKVKKFGIEFEIGSSSETQGFWKNFYPNIWENGTFNWIVPLLDSEKYFIDIGAWEGPISLVAQKFSKKCICFEPDPIAFDILCKNVRLNKFENIICENLAVSTEKKLSIGHERGLGVGGSSYLNSENSVSCNTISFSEIIEKYNLTEDNVSVIKIDIEGYERELLKDESLRNFNVNKHISFHPILFNDRFDYFNDIRSFFPNDHFIKESDMYEYGLNKKL